MKWYIANYDEKVKIALILAREHLKSQRKIIYKFVTIAQPNSAARSAA